MKNKLSILLTGASGTVGFEVLKQLATKKDTFDLTIFDLKSNKSVKTFAPYKNNITIIYGDISKNTDIKKACANKDFIIHLAAIIPPLADDKPELSFKVNTTGTENLIRNLEQLSPDCFFLYSSSISVYGDRLKNPLIKVTDPILPSEGDEYAKTKIKAEQIIQNSKLNWSIFRLAAIMGNHKISKLMFHQPLATSLEIATPEDTARVFINAIEHKKLISKKIFNLGGGKDCQISYEKFLTRSFSIFGLGKLSFPEKTFAEKNFHCGFYQDSDDLDNILKFRNHTLENYFENEKLKIPFWKKILTIIFKKQIKNYLLKQSEPFHAVNTNDQKMMKHFFN